MVDYPHEEVTETKTLDTKLIRKEAKEMNGDIVSSLYTKMPVDYITAL